MTTKSVLSLLLSFALTPFLSAGPIITIKSKEGKSLTAELLAVKEDSARLKMPSNNKEYTLAFTKLDDSSVELIKSKADALPIVYPPLDVDVVIGKRRKKVDGSYYMVTMDITSSLKIKNTSVSDDCPETKGRLIFFGEDQKTKGRYNVLATRDFKISPEAGKTTELVLAGFPTKYDSDNQGEGNVGGFKYEAYLFMLWDKNNNIVMHKSTSTIVNRAIDADAGVLNSYRKISEGKTLNKEMIP